MKRKRKCKPFCDGANKETETVRYSNGTTHLSSICRVCGKREYLPKQWGKDAGVDFEHCDVQKVSTKPKDIAASKVKASNVEIATAFLTNHHIGWTEFSGSHWRIGDVDYWPTTQKSYHRITHQKGQGLTDLLSLINNHAVPQAARKKNWDKFFNENKHQRVNAGFSAAAGLGRKYGLKKGFNK